MNSLNFEEISEYVNKDIDTFHTSRIRTLSSYTLTSLINKNHYLLRAKNVTKASELIEGALTAKMSSSEEELFGQFLEGLAIFVAEKTTGGHKSGTKGIDLEFEIDGCHYFVSIKSGTNWGNNSQQTDQESDFNSALKVFRQLKGQRTQVDAILGICYGKVKTSRVRGALKLVGQNFWTFISGNRDLFTQIIEPIGYRSKEHNDAYNEAAGNVINLRTKEFIDRFCDPVTGSIHWEQLLQSTCGNFDLNQNGFSY
jgi:hypothetical protein